MTAPDAPEFSPPAAPPVPPAEGQVPPASTPEPKPAAASAPAAPAPKATGAVAGGEAKPTAAPPPKKPEAKPPPPPPLAPEIYRRGLDLLREVVALRETERLPTEKIREAEQMAKDLRAELSKTLGTEEYVLADLEKKSITFRQGEELARALTRAIEGVNLDQALRAGRQRVTKAVIGLAILAIITVIIGAGTVGAGSFSQGVMVLETILVLVCLGVAVGVWRTGRPFLRLWRGREQKRAGTRVVDTET